MVASALKIMQQWPPPQVGKEISVRFIQKRFVITNCVINVKDPCTGIIGENNVNQVIPSLDNQQKVDGKTH